MKNSQAPIRRYAIGYMEIVSTQVPAEQFINIIESPLAADLEVPTCQELIKILPCISVAKSGGSKDYIHWVILATAIRSGNSPKTKATQVC